MLTVVVSILALAVSSDARSSASIADAVERSIQEVRASHATLPPPSGDIERLIRLGELDQAARKVMVATDFSKVSEAERPALMAKVSAMMDAVDLENQTALLALVPPEGWFLRSRYGPAAAGAAFHIVQHADLRLQERFLPVLEPLVRSGEVDGQAYGLMFDRVAIQRDRPQRYGSQFRCDGGKWRPYPIADADGVEARRKELNFPGTFASMKAYMEKAPPCPQTPRPPPVGMKLD